MKNILAFGDSNTWGLVPGSNPHVRYSKDIRWTGILQRRMANANIVEEGLCGRTTVFEDSSRPGRKAISTLPTILESNDTFSKAIIMLGTNDCKTEYHSTPKEISDGIERCLIELEKHIDSKDILLVSPVLLGNYVWKKDIEFCKESIKTCNNLKSAYQSVAKKHGTLFLAASDFADVDEADDEHLNESGHRALADAIYNVLNKPV